MARVITTSSGFFDVLLFDCQSYSTGYTNGGARVSLHGVDGALAGGDVAEHRAESFCCHFCMCVDVKM